MQGGACGCADGGARRDRGHRSRGLQLGLGGHEGVLAIGVGILFPLFLDPAIVGCLGLGCFFRHPLAGALVEIVHESGPRGIQLRLHRGGNVPLGRLFRQHQLASGGTVGLVGEDHGVTPFEFFQSLVPGPLLVFLEQRLGEGRSGTGRGGVDGVLDIGDLPGRGAGRHRR